MDVDTLEQQQQQHPQDASSATDTGASSPEIQVQLSPDDPFDLEAYIAPYTDRRRITRLLFIAKRCPDLRVAAYKLALDTIKETSLDYNLYLSIGNLCKEVEVDRNWVRDAKKKQESGFDKLDVELKNYQNNLIKESIRMGYRDIGDFQRRSGDLTAAVRSYTKSKDYCTTAHHLLDMCLNVIDTALDQSAYATVRNYVIKAESALASISGPSKGPNEAGTAGSSRGVSLPGMLASAQPGRREEEARSKHYQMMSDKLSVANAVANLGQRELEKAARGFLNVSPPVLGGTASTSSTSARENASTGTAHYIPPADIGLYGVLTAMATFSRTQFKRLVIDNSNLRPYLEYTPFLKELIQQYYNSRFLSVLDTLNQNMTRLQLDVHLAAQVDFIMAKIKDKIVELYFEPFSSVKIDKMAAALGWDAATLEAAVVRLIESGSMKARIDKRAQTIVAYGQNERDALYEHTLKVADENARSTQMLAYRMRLIQNDVIVDVRKDYSKGQGQKGRREKTGREIQGESITQEGEISRIAVE